MASVDHPGNSNSSDDDDEYLVEGFSSGWERARDNSLLLEHPEAEHRIGVDLIGAAGFSFGGCSRHDVGGKIDADIMAEVFHSLIPAPEVPKFPALIKTALSKYSDAELTSFAETAGDSMADSRLRERILPARALRLLLQLPQHPRPGKQVVGERPLAPFQQATSE